VYWS